LTGGCKSQNAVQYLCRKTGIIGASEEILRVVFSQCVPLTSRLYCH